MSQNPRSPLDLGTASEETRELFRSPFETDEYRRAMLQLQQQQNDLLKRLAPRSRDDVSKVGGDTTARQIGGSQTSFTHNGTEYTIPRVVPANQHVFVGNQRYEDGQYDDVSSTLSQGETKTFASINATTPLLLEGLTASAHPDVEYIVEIDGRRDEALSGPSPPATPPDLYTPVPGGFLLVGNRIEFKLRETSGNTAHDNAEASLKAIIPERE